MLPMRPSWYLAMKGSLSAAYSFFNNLTLQADILYASFKINIFQKKKKKLIFSKLGLFGMPITWQIITFGDKQYIINHREKRKIRSYIFTLYRDAI